MWTTIIFVCCFASVFGASTTRAPRTTPQPLTSTPPKQMTTTEVHGHHTHRPHATHAPTYSENMQFTYDGASELFLALSGHNCYIYTLSENEKMNILDLHSFRTMETNLINLIDSGASFSVMSHDELLSKSKMFSHKCRSSYSLYRLN